MHLPSDQPEASVGFGTYVEQLGYELHRAFGSSTNHEERISAISRLQKDPVFRRWLMPEFMPNLISGDDTNNMLKLTVQISSEETPSRRIDIGGSLVSPVYLYVTKRLSNVDRNVKLLQRTRDLSRLVCPS